MTSGHRKEERWTFCVSHDRGITWRNDSPFNGYRPERASDWVIEWLMNGWGYASYISPPGSVIIRDKAKPETLYRWKKLEP